MAHVVFDLNDGNEFVVKLMEDIITLGRGEYSHIRIDNSYISTHHAEFRKLKPGVYEVWDMGSLNGVYVNGHRVLHQTLKDRDKLKFGQLEAVYRKS